MNAAGAGAVRGHIQAAYQARYVFVDVWRGLAIIGVVVYHFVWDLSFFGFIPPSAAFNWPMTVFARSLAGSFMFLVGVSLVLAHKGGIRWRAFLRRLSKVVVAAAAISTATYFMFPEGFVYFGILHSIAAASLIGLAFLSFPTWLALITAAAVLTAPLFFETPAFDTRILAWIGFAAQPPMANDFVPIFPWFGVTLAGIGCARLFLSQRIVMDAPSQLAGGAVVQGLAWVGQRTLLIYLVHQPLLFAGFIVFTRLGTE